jgi:hypothetical protein
MADLLQQMPQGLEPGGNVGSGDVVMFDRFGADQQAFRARG